MITIEDVAKVEMRVGLVIESTAVEGSDKLIREVVDFGTEKRIIFSGLRKWYQPEELLGKKFLYIVNLEPRKMPSFIKTAEGSVQEESQGMILVADGPEGKPILIPVSDEAPSGAKTR